jgi:hypothetical protein
LKALGSILSVFSSPRRALMLQRGQKSGEVDHLDSTAREKHCGKFIELQKSLQLSSILRHQPAVRSVGRSHAA